MKTQNAEEWTIDRWKTATRLLDLELMDAVVEDAPPLWKDVTLASALALLIWAAAAFVVG